MNIYTIFKLRYILCDDRFLSQAAPICYFYSQLPYIYCVVMPCPLQTLAAKCGPNLNSKYQGWPNRGSRHRLYFFILALPY